MDYADRRAAADGLETRFDIVSNLTLMNNEIARDVQARGNVNFCSSLDGPAGVHDRQRIFPGGCGTHDRTLRGAAILREHTGRPMSFLPTFTRNGLGHEREIVDEYLAQGCRGVYLRYVNRTGRAFESGYDDIGVTAGQFVQAWKTTLEYALEKNRRGEFVIEGETANLLGNMLDPGFSFMCARRPCGCAVSQVVVEHDGTVYGCDGGRSVEMLALGNVRTDTYDRMYTSAAAQALRTLASETLPVCRSCAFGAYCGYCVARGINQHANPVPNIPQDFECQIYKEMIPHLFHKLLDRETARILMKWLRPFPDAQERLQKNERQPEGKESREEGNREEVMPNAQGAGSAQNRE
jgi:radical SAM protein with 4Fe4S-binding SPASM domain